MKKVTALLLSATACLYINPVLALENYKLDPNHTYVSWQVDHFGFSHPSGKWVANGNLQVDKSNLANSKVNVTIKMDDLSTGIKEFDNHLKGKMFFQTDKFPTATFVSDKVEMSDNQIHKVYGTLTLKGVSKPVILEVTPNKTGINPVTEKETMGFSATTQIKRSDFGISAFVPDVGDDIKMQIEVEAYKE